jgi:hypothetical protein
MPAQGLELSGGPSRQNKVDVLQGWKESRRTESTILFDPAANPSDSRRRDAQRAAARRAGQQDVAGRYICESRKFGDCLGGLEHEVGNAVSLPRFSVHRAKKVEVRTFFGPEHFNAVRSAARTRSGIRAAAVIVTFRFKELEGEPGLEFTALQID